MRAPPLVPPGPILNLSLPHSSCSQVLEDDHVVAPAEDPARGAPRNCRRIASAAIVSGSPSGTKIFSSGEDDSDLPVSQYVKDFNLSLANLIDVHRGFHDGEEETHYPRVGFFAEAMTVDSFMFSGSKNPVQHAR